LGVDSHELRNLPKKERVRNKYSIKKDATVFLFLAPIEPHKGPDIFVKGAIQTLKLIPAKKVLFIIATYNSPGSEPYEKRKSELMRLIGDEKRHFQIFEGVLNVKELMGLADVVVVPQTTLDGATGHPVTLLEAMVARKIVIASNIHGPNEVIKDGYNGFLFRNKSPRSLAEKMIYIVKNRSCLGDIEKSAYKTVVKKYFLRATAKKIDNLYKKGRL
jgi:glycosyltransferase involved in cell wall biosynthesis